LDKKGKIYDIQGNIVGQVNTKNGKMATMHGWHIGKYKPKSQMTNLLIEEAITKHSPYELQRRKLLLLQQQQLAEQLALAELQQKQSISLFGIDAMSDSYRSQYGEDMRPARANIGVTAWGARADNVHGVFADNAWGTMADNVWGGVSSDVWGSVDGSSLWGVKGPKMFGTGNGRNYLKSFTNLLAGLFGFGTKKNQARLQAFRAASGSSGPRAGGSAPARRR
jgi:hypothetical protein